MCVNASLIVQYVIQVKNRLMKHVIVGAKTIAQAKQIIFGILEHVFVRTIDI